MAGILQGLKKEAGITNMLRPHGDASGAHSTSGDDGDLDQVDQLDDDVEVDSRGPLQRLNPFHKKAAAHTPSASAEPKEEGARAESEKKGGMLSGFFA